MAKSDFERKTEQLLSQMEDLRSNLEDWIGIAQIQMSRATRKARRGLREAGEEFAEAGIPWWVPVAAIAVIGIGIAVANMFGMRVGEEEREEFAQRMAGQPPTAGMPGQH